MIKFEDGGKLDTLMTVLLRELFNSRFIKQTILLMLKKSDVLVAENPRDPFVPLRVYFSDRRSPPIYSESVTSVSILL